MSRLCLAALAVLATSCAPDRRARPPAGTPRECPALVWTYVPAGMTRRERVAVPQGMGASGVRTAFADDRGRTLEFSAGIAGELEGATETGRRRIRGHDAGVLRANDVLVALWLERPVDEPCHQYEIVAEGLDETEFAKVLDGIE